MPSPAAHSLIGLALAVTVLRPAGRLRALAADLWERRKQLLVILAMANLPDLDYLPGIVTGKLNAFHYEYTHTAGWIIAMTLVLWLAWKSKDRRVGWALFGIMLVAGASHLLADWVTDDRAPPYGIMAFWPLTGQRYMCSVHVFGSLWKADWADVMKLHNVKIVLFEVLTCLPLLGLALGYQWHARRSRASGLSGTADSGKMPAR